MSDNPNNFPLPGGDYPLPQPDPGEAGYPWPSLPQPQPLEPYEPA